MKLLTIDNSFNSDSELNDNLNDNDIKYTSNIVYIKNLYDEKIKNNIHNILITDELVEDAYLYSSDEDEYLYSND